MAVTEFQRTICRLIARQRIESGVSYESVMTSWTADREILENSGYAVHALRERETFVEASVSRTGDSVVLQWTLDSAFRFFPLIEHEDFGLALHPFDLATNKVLALVGRVEARDWVDIIQCHDKIQRLGYLAWAASGKDPGFSPAAILDQAGRSARYSTAEINALSFSDKAPDAVKLSRAWHAMLEEGRDIVRSLPPGEAGKCVLGSRGCLFRGTPAELSKMLESSSLSFHEGCLHGALPRVRDL